jgi:hypothetical protein
MLRKYRSRPYTATKKLFFNTSSSSVAADLASSPCSISSHNARSDYQEQTDVTAGVSTLTTIDDIMTNKPLSLSVGDDDDDDNNNNIINSNVAVGDVEKDIKDGIELTNSFPIPCHPTFDEWEAAIVKSMSERPDEIFDIFEKYAVGRRDHDTTMEVSSSWKEQQQQSRDDDGDDGRDDDTYDNEQPEGGFNTRRDDIDRENERRKRLDEYKESYIAELVEKLRLKEVMASLTYRTIVSVDSDAIPTISPTILQDDQHDESNIQLQAKLEAAEKERHQMAEQMKEDERLHTEKVASLQEEITYWQSELRALLEQNEAASSTKYQSDETDADEASRMDDTQVMNDSPESSVTTGNVVTDTTRIADSEHSTTSKFERMLRQLETRNNELEQALKVCQKSNGVSGHRIHELQAELQRERKAHSAEKKRGKKLDLLVSKAENLLQIQGGKLRRVEQSQRKTQAICEMEISKRESLERLTEKLKVAIEKMKNKLNGAEGNGGSIAALTTELERKNAMIAAIKSILVDPTLN